jgi:GT2 family glycosyltransferase
LSSEITIICCTANRRVQITEFIKLAMKNFKETKLIIVENSKDRVVYEQLKKQFSRNEMLEILYSPINGLSNARNIGLAFTRTPFVAFTDDDCLPSQNWLDNILYCFNEYDADVVAGKIKPIWPQNKSPRINDKIFLESLAILDFGSSIRKMTEHEFAVGANMAFRKSVLGDLKFDTNLGRVGSTLLSGEEVEFQKELKRRGALFYYTPEAVVSHKIDEERLDPTWFLSRFAWQGVSDAKSDYDFKEIEFQLYSAAKTLKMDKAISKLLSNEDKNIVERALLLRYLLASALMLNNSNKVKLIRTTGYFHPIPISASTIVIDFSKFHAFLLKSIDSSTVHNYVIHSNPWLFRKNELDLEFKKLFTSIIEHGNIKLLIFTSIDSFLLEHLFPTFHSALKSINLRIKLGIHRIPKKNEMVNLQRLSRDFDIFVFSEAVREFLLEHHLKVDLFPVMGSLFNTFHNPNVGIIGSDSKETYLKLLHLGEIRETQTPNYLQKFLQTNVNRQVKIKVMGGCTNKSLFKKMLKLASNYPNNLNLDDFYFYNQSSRDSYQVVPDINIIHALRKSHAAIKIQLNEKYAASAVVADCINLGVPVITLSGTESASQVKDLWPYLTIKDLSEQEIDRVLNELENSSFDKTLSFKISKENRKFFNELFIF